MKTTTCMILLTILIYINMSGGYSGSNVDSGAGPGEAESSGY